MAIENNYVLCFRILIICVFGLGSGTSLGAEPNQVAPLNTYSFGIVPQQSKAIMINTWGPFLDYVSEQSNVTLQIKTQKTIALFEDFVFEGEYDFVYMNPYHYVVFHEEVGYKAVAKAKDKKIKGIIVVRKDSPIMTLDELAGKELAFPSPGAFAASIITRSYLKKNDIPFSPVYVGSHTSVYGSVINEHHVAGGGVVRTLNTLSKDNQACLRILWVSDPYTPHAFAVHPRVPQDIVDRVIKAMFEMDRNEKGRSILKNLSLKGVEKGEDKDWDDIRSLGIELPLGSIGTPKEQQS